MIRQMPPSVRRDFPRRLHGPGARQQSAGSRPQEPRRPRTVLEFLENEAALEKTLAICLNDPGGVGRTPGLCKRAATPTNA